jgi:hypothetical protein
VTILMLLMDGHDELEKLFQIAAIKLHAYNIDALVSCTHVTQLRNYGFI